MQNTTQKTKYIYIHNNIAIVQFSNYNNKQETDQTICVLS